MRSKSIVHFGIKSRMKANGHKLTRENYAVVSNKSTLGKNRIYIHALETNDKKMIESYSKVFTDNEGLIYSEEWCENQMKKAMLNYDLNMEFFKCLNNDEFNEEVSNFLNKTNFFEITDLNEYSCEGYYVMIIEEYCQVYIGTSKDIKKRIKQHWSGKIGFDRLVCGEVDKSKLSIKSFRELDTTRIFVYPTTNTYIKEEEYINKISSKFVCNRINGGIMEFGMLSVTANLKKRELNNTLN